MRAWLLSRAQSPDAEHEDSFLINQKNAIKCMKPLYHFMDNSPPAAG